jgi:DHA1 family bicyclomycin/chloramphenicol resistance-like MFS transporter
MSLASILFLLVGLSNGFVEMGSDIYAPCLPQICEIFNCTPAMASLTMALNLAAIAISGLFWGPLSDQFGRRKIILIGMGIFTLGLALCAISQGLNQLIVARCLQGVGGGVAGVVGMAMLKDVLSGPALATMISRITLIICISPGIAPLLGGWIAQYGGWRGIFLVSVFVTLLFLVALWRYLPETYKPKTGRVKMNLKSSLAAYRALFRSPRYLGFLAIHALTFFWLWSQLANMPFFYIVQMGIKVSAFGYYTIAGVSMFVLGVIANQFLVKRIAPMTLIGYGIALQLVSGLLLTGLGTAAWLTPFWVVVILAPSGLGLALTIGDAYALALEEAKRYAGAGAALILFMEVTMGASGMYVLSLYVDYGIVSLGVLMTLAILAMLGVYQWIRRLDRAASKV